MEQINQKIKEEYLKKKVEKLKRKINEESPEENQLIYLGDNDDSREDIDYVADRSENVPQEKDETKSP